MATPTLSEVLTQARAYLRVTAVSTDETNTVAEVFSAIRSLLADVDTAGGEEFTDTVLAEPYKAAYRELYAQLVANGLTSAAPATPPGSGSIGLANSLRFLSLRAAALVMRPREGGVSIADALDARADEARRTWLDGLMQIQDYSDAALLPFYGDAYRELYGQMNIWGIPQSERQTTPITVAAQTTEVDPVAQGWTDLGTPYLVEERTPGSSESWQTVWPVEELRGIYAGNPVLGYYEFTGGKFKFDGSSASRSLRIKYQASGSPPTSGSVGIDDTLQFLGLRTAALAATLSRDKAIAATSIPLSQRADQALDAWISAKVKQMQSVTLRRPAFRTW